MRGPQYCERKHATWPVGAAVGATDFLVGRHGTREEQRDYELLLSGPQDADAVADAESRWGSTAEMDQALELLVSTVSGEGSWEEAAVVAVGGVAMVMEGRGGRGGDHEAW